jgi:two-component system sensor histidine kinase KdpD
MTGRTVSRWLLWGSLLLLVSVTLVYVRDATEQMYVPVIYLLLVLGGSAGGGRALGFTLAAASFVVIDYYLQTPYGLLSFGRVIDFVTLGAFFTTAAVASQLLDQARRERDAAIGRTEEVTALSRVGSESLSAPLAADAVAAVAAVIRLELGAEECAIVPSGAAASLIDSLDNRTVSVALHIREHQVGTLVLRFAKATELNEAKRAFLDALKYYAALALERAALAVELEHSAALREADRMKDFVLASVSHDLRTPLTSIKALAQDEQVSGVSRAREIEIQADRLTRLVADLLDLSRLRSGAFSVTPEFNAADDVIGVALRQCEPLASGRSLCTSVDAAGSPTLYGRFDFVQTLRILVNLIENAVRYSPAGAQVDVEVRREGSSLLFTVADRGPGIPLAEQERVFDPFYRPDGWLPDRGRAGLGLAIVRSLVDTQGGEVHYRDREGGGSIFEVRLPSADVDVASVGES